MENVRLSQNVFAASKLTYSLGWRRDWSSLPALLEGTAVLPPGAYFLSALSPVFGADAECRGAIVRLLRIGGKRESGVFHSYLTFLAVFSYFKLHISLGMGQKRLN